MEIAPPQPEVSDGGQQANPEERMGESNAVESAIATARGVQPGKSAVSQFVREHFIVVRPGPTIIETDIRNKLKIKP